MQSLAYQEAAVNLPAPWNCQFDSRLSPDLYIKSEVSSSNRTRQYIFADPSIWQMLVWSFPAYMRLLIRPDSDHSL